MTRKANSQKGRKLRGGTLFAISLLLIGSAAVRLGLEAGPAVAREAVSLKEERGEEEQIPSGAEAEPTKGDLQALITALQERDKLVSERERSIEDRTKALAIAEKAIDSRLAMLKAAEEELSATLALADVASEDDLTQLTAVYENMKPKQAAALFEEMDPEFAAGFLSRMRPDGAANIMAGLSPMAAYTISVVLAGRNATVPTE